VRPTATATGAGRSTGPARGSVPLTDALTAETIEAPLLASAAARPYGEPVLPSIRLPQVFVPRPRAGDSYVGSPHDAAGVADNLADNLTDGEPTPRADPSSGPENRPGDKPGNEPRRVRCVRAGPVSVRTGQRCRAVPSTGQWRPGGPVERL